jgi:hypothetical protein
MAHRDSTGVRLITRQGNDFTSRFPLTVAAVTALRARSFLIDGEAIVTNASGLAVFDLIRRKRHGGDAVLIAFDLIELDGEDLRRSPIEHRKRKLAKLDQRPTSGHRVERALRRRRRDRFRARLQARLRGYRFKAARLALSLGALAVLGEGQKPQSASRDARGRRGLGPLNCRNAASRRRCLSRVTPNCYVVRDA